jgi:hypothetical protein
MASRRGDEGRPHAAEPATLPHPLGEDRVYARKHGTNRRDSFAAADADKRGHDASSQTQRLAPVRKPECAPAAYGQIVSAPIAINTETKRPNECCGVSGDQCLAAKRTREAATSANIVSP